MKIRILKYEPWPNLNFEDTWFRWTRKDYQIGQTIKEKNYKWYDKVVFAIQDAYLTVLARPYCRMVAWFRSKPMFARVKVRIDPWDTWGMDSTLAYIITPMLKQLKATKHGAPYVELDDVPDHLRPKSEEKPTDGSTDEFHFERWDWILGEMIFAFESKNSDWEDQFRSGELDMQFEPCRYDDEGDPSMYEMVRGPNDTYKVDDAGMKAYADRMQNGFRLFGKYYSNLWD